MIPLKDQAALKQRFARDLSGGVRIDFFTQKPSPIFVPGRQDCVTCEDVRKLMQELSGLDRRISLTQHDIDDDAETARSLGVDKVPGIVLRGATNRPIRYFGSPALRQFATFIELLLLVARGKGNLQPETIRTLKRIRPTSSPSLRKPVLSTVEGERGPGGEVSSPPPRTEAGSAAEVKLFVTPNCVYSPSMVLTAASIALANPHISFEVIEANEFPPLAQRYYVQGTPHTVLNDVYAIPGVMDETRLAENLLLVAQGKDPTVGGDLSKLTPLAPPQPQQPPRPSPSSGLVLPR